MTLTEITGTTIAAVSLAVTLGARAPTPDRVKTMNGVVEGTAGANGVRMFRGIPFAAPPVGDLRWQPPQPAKNWSGVLMADKFGARCMQRSLFGDMAFRANGMSEDCLFLNVWTPAKSASERLPVLVYFYGGGFAAGDGSEPRYDGESMAERGIVALTVNYRLSVFGFLAHPELTKESPHHASGNYGLLDQVAALRWVQSNIAAFGGDPRHVTIAGESAGSISVHALMASPLSKNLIGGAIGESGAMINPTLPPITLAEGEKNGVAFATAAGASSLQALRAMPAQGVLDVTAKSGLPSLVSATIDGYFLPSAPADIFAAGQQAHVPLLAGWNSMENPAQAVLGAGGPPTAESYMNALKRLYGDQADAVAKVYPGTTPEEILDSAQALASDRFIAFSTWKWTDQQGRTGGKPVFRYFYAHPRPSMRPEMGNATAGLAGGVTRGTGPAQPQAPARGAVHSAEIEYAMGNLSSNKVYGWTADDTKVSELMQAYFANFVKTWDPNGGSLPKWIASNSPDGVYFMRIDVEPKLEKDTREARYRLLDSIYAKKP